MTLASATHLVCRAVVSDGRGTPPHRQDRGFGAVRRRGAGRDHGGTAAQVGGIEHVVPFDCNVFEWDQTCVNPIYGRSDPRRDFPVLPDLYRRGALRLDDMIARRYALDQMQYAFADLLAGKLAKGLILLGG